MGMEKEKCVHESLDILIVSIKLHMIINMIPKQTYLHIQWAVIECLLYTQHDWVHGCKRRRIIPALLEMESIGISIEHI